MIDPEDRPIDDIRSDNAEMLDRAMHDILINGEEVVTPDGQTVRKAPSAAMLNAIAKRTKDLRIQSPAAPGSAAARLLDEAARRGKGIRFDGKDITPPLDTEGEDAATG